MSPSWNKSRTENEMLASLLRLNAEFLLQYDTIFYTGFDPLTAQFIAQLNCHRGTVIPSRSIEAVCHAWPNLSDQIHSPLRGYLSRISSISTLAVSEGPQILVLVNNTIIIVRYIIRNIELPPDVYLPAIKTLWPV